MGRIFRYAPGVSCVLGPLDSAPKLRKAPQRQPKKALGEVVNPDKLDVAEEARDSKETEKNYEALMKALPMIITTQKMPCSDLVADAISASRHVESQSVVVICLTDLIGRPV